MLQGPLKLHLSRWKPLEVYEPAGRADERQTRDRPAPPRESVNLLEKTQAGNVTPD
jgi:hypothetical protein